jgi:CheY-like chemotaxis protein
MSYQRDVILLAEDEENDVLLIQRALDRARLANPVRVAEDGEAVISYLSGTGKFADRKAYPFPCLLLLDLKMPRMSGFEVIQRIRANEEWKRLLIVVLTSSNLHPDINKAYELGANSYLVKPPDLEALVEMMKNLQSYWLITNERPR